MEVFDNELKEMMGDRYDDGDVPAEMPVMENPTKAEPEAVPQNREVKDAEYVPYPNARRGLMDKLAGALKYLGICGGICMLLWWFEVNGQMDMEAAYPCILLSAMIGSGGVVWSVK